MFITMKFETDAIPPKCNRVNDTDQQVHAKISKFEC
jgi:hypothetical protein